MHPPTLTHAPSLSAQHPPEVRRSPPPSPSGKLIAAILAVGIGLRLVQYAGNRSLWLDEALMVPGIVDRSFTELLHPANWGAVPPGFLFLTKLAVTILGNNEYALRLIPITAGVASLFLFLAVARRCLSPRAVPFALALFAISPFLIYYASELKQYSSDVAVALLLLWLGLDLSTGTRGTAVDPLARDPLSRRYAPPLATPSPGATRHPLPHKGGKGCVAGPPSPLVGEGPREGGLRQALLWCVAGIVAVGFSFTAAFVVAGVTAALIVRFWRVRDWYSVRYLLFVCAAWALVFGVPYMLFLAGLAKNEYLSAFWASGYMPFPPRSIADLAWYPDTLLRVFRDPLGVMGDRQTDSAFFQPAAGMLAFAAGCLWMWSRRRDRLLILVAPIGVTLLASALALYPFGGTWTSGGRVILFLAPAFFLVMGEGIEQMRRRLGPSMRPLAFAAFALLLLPSLVWAAIMVPSGRDEIKPLLTYVQEHWRDGDLLYVHYEIKQPFQYYAPRYGVAEDDVISGVCARGEPRGYLDALSELQGQPRVWVLFGQGKGASGFDERGLMLDFLDHLGERVDERRAMEASLYLYDLSAAAASSGEYSVRIPPIPASVETSCALWN